MNHNSLLENGTQAFIFRSCQTSSFLIIKELSFWLFLGGHVCSCREKDKPTASFSVLRAEGEIYDKLINSNIDKPYHVSLPGYSNTLTGKLALSSSRI